jgi:hypothetical protein
LIATEAFREIALLWFVFANLDVIVQHQFSWRWSIANSLGAFVLWSAGVAIESGTHERRTP